MKRFAVLLSVFALIIFAAPAFSAEMDAKKADKKIHCCNKKTGDCTEMTKAECKKEKHTVVSDCAKCKKPATKPSKSKTDM